MLVQQNVLDTIASNMANASTVGFKQDVSTFRELTKLAISRYSSSSTNAKFIGDIGLGVEFAGNVTDMRAGSSTDTGNPLDLAIDGDGFFALQTPGGERYSRAGQFHLQPAGKSADGKPIAELVNDAGYTVLGVKGPISITDARDVSIASDGTVKSGGVAVDQLKIVTATAAGTMKKQGGSLFAANGALTTSKAVVRSGWLEQSNVNPIDSMVRMISVQRAYDAAQKAVSAQNDELGKAVSDLPKT
jgi:flagellar basal-body rod protein FlgF